MGSLPLAMLPEENPSPIRPDMFPFLSPVHYRKPDSVLRTHRRTVGWLEKTSKCGEEWLIETAERGSCYGMTKLGLRLLTGDGVEQSAQRGLEWLRKAAKAQYLLAMEILAAFLLDSHADWASSIEGEELLREAAELGHLFSRFSLGHRLLRGDGVNRDENEGLDILRSTGRAGDRLAMSVLGAEFLRRGHSDTAEGYYWTRCAGANTPQMIPRLGRYVYSRACGTITKRERERIATEAANLFAFRLEDNGYDAFSALNLAFLIRRGEVSDTQYPSFEDLIEKPLSEENAGAIVNQALRLASGYRCNADWKAADDLVARLQGSLGVLEWWLARAREGDAEGHLVIGWLMRMSLTTNLDDVDLRSRLDLARAAFTDIPEWMYDRRSS